MFTPAPFSQLPPSLPVLVLPFDAVFCPFGNIINTGGQGKASGAYTTANTAVAFPFYVGEPTTIYKMGWINGSSAGGNTDVGIYDASWALLGSTGSTARTGNSLAQFVDTANITLAANTLYYAATNHSQTNANNVNGLLANANTTNLLTLVGVKQMAVGATALPATFTPADPTAARLIPTILFSTVAAVV